MPPCRYCPLLPAPPKGEDASLRLLSYVSAAGFVAWMKYDGSVRDYSGQGSTEAREATCFARFFGRQVIRVGVARRASASGAFAIALSLQLRGLRDTAWRGGCATLRGARGR